MAESPLSHALSELAVGLSRLGATGDRARRAANELWGGVLGGALSPRERENLTARLYGFRTPRHWQAAGLWGWERAWFERRLPKAPATILVGGAGGGRDAVPLVEAGYAVTAFDPSTALVDSLSIRLGPGHRALRGSYADLCEALEDGRGPLAGLCGETFDAFVVGWGSLSHVLDAGVLRRMFVAAGALAPRGPILASFAPAPIGRRGRGDQWGRRLGRFLGELRGVDPAGPDETYTPWFGFGRTPPEAELEELAELAGGRALILEQDYDTYPHVSFLLE